MKISTTTTTIVSTSTTTTTILLSSSNQVVGAISICNRISDDWGDRSLCLIIVKKNLFACEEIPEIPYSWKKDLCYEGIAKVSDDYSLCEKMSDNICYYNFAIRKNDLSICKLISNPYLKDECYSKIAATDKDDKLCEEIQDQSNRDDCYEDVAESKRDPSLCEKMSFQYPGYRDNCYLRVAVAKRDPSICKKAYVIPDICSHNVIAVSKKDPSECDALPTEYHRSDCIYGVAMAHKDSAICDNMSNNTSFQYLEDIVY